MPLLEDWSWRVSVTCASPKRAPCSGSFAAALGVPLIDGGTVRLPQIVGLGRALDLILTGRPVSASEAHGMGLVNRVVPTGMARRSAEQLAKELARLPQNCLRSDRMATLLQFDEPKPIDEALRREFQLGMQTILSGRDGRWGGSLCLGRRPSRQVGCLADLSVEQEGDEQRVDDQRLDEGETEDHRGEQLVRGTRGCERCRREQPQPHDPDRARHRMRRCRVRAPQRERTSGRFQPWQLRAKPPERRQPR
jgi:hypothetical protein